jgi:hypothetical protein
LRAWSSLALVMLAVAACDKDDRPPPATTPEAAPPPAIALSERRVHWNMVPRPARLPCRAIAVRGNVALRDAPPAASPAIDGGATSLAANAEIPDGAWVTLGDPAASVTLKDPRSARETILGGAGDARPCVDRAEETWLARGTFESSPPSGEVPGAEQWVVTPAGVVRYGASKLSIAVTPTGVRVKVGSGVAQVSFGAQAEAGAAAGGDAGWTKLEAGGSIEAHVTPDARGLRGAQDAVARCVSAGDAAKAIAAKISAPSGAPLRGDLAASHVVARLDARAACALAHLRVALLPSKPSPAPSSANASDFEAKLAAADDAWQSSEPSARANPRPNVPSTLPPAVTGVPSSSSR